MGRWKEASKATNVVKRGREAVFIDSFSRYLTNASFSTVDSRSGSYCMVKIRSDCIFLAVGSDGRCSLPLCFVGLTWTDEICLSGVVWIAGAMGLYREINLAM